ncbi:MAG: hypothetical protein ACRDEA_12065 [Microcystaceae cyanobacterium]
MKHLVEFSLEDGNTILVEVDEPGESIERVALRAGGPFSLVHLLL